MLDNYHKWDQVSKFHKTHIFPSCSLCLHLRDDPWLRKRGCSINWNPFNQSFCLPEVSWPDSLHAWQWGPGTISTGFETTWDWHTHQQQDGPCKGEDTDAVTNVQTMDDIKGDWWDADVCKRGLKQGSRYRWVLWGVNCGEAPYPGGYDWYPCQHERFIQQVEWL